MDLTGVPVIDNHCHPLDPSKATLEAQMLAKEFYHGLGDITSPGSQEAKRPASPALMSDIANLGVVQTMVCQLAQVLGCPADLEMVAQERNRRTAHGLADYAKLLYADAGIAATVVDSDLRQDNPTLRLIPGRIMRLFQMGPAMDKALASAHSYAALLQNYQDSLDKAIRNDGFVGVKAHLAEVAGFGAEAVPAAEAERAFGAAKEGNAAAYKKLYVAVFVATLLQCRDLDVPVHVHSGCTGGLWDGSLLDGDPYLLIPLIRRPEFRQTKVVLLHAGYPWIQKCSAMAHALPNVWVDIGWVTPWISLRATECFRELIAMAPLSRLMIGSGGHGSPEIAWLAAKVAKIALAEVLGDATRLGLMASAQAETVARMVLHDNAAHLYKL
jgi:uncharacterized protein